MKTAYCLINPDGQIALRQQHDPENDVWHIDAGWSLRPASECTGLPDAPPAPPRNALQILPEDFWMSKAQEAQRDYAGLTTLYSTLLATGAITAETLVNLGTLSGTRKVTHSRYLQIMAQYGLTLAAELFPE